MGPRVMMLGAGLLTLGACARPPESFDSPLPSARTDALTDPARIHEPESIRGRIELLDSDDPLVRMLAIRSLERMTGTTLGYDHAADPWKRDEAVRRWVEWYEQGGATSAARKRAEPEEP